MKQHVVGVGVVAALLTGFGLTFTACSHPTGPSLTGVIETRRLVPSSQFPNPQDLCCCRILGTVRNTSSIPVHIQLRFTATNVEGRAAGTATTLVSDIPAGAVKEFEAAGIQEACARVAKVDDRVLVLGLYDLPK